MAVSYRNNPKSALEPKWVRKATEQLVRKLINDDPPYQIKVTTDNHIRFRLGEIPTKIVVAVRRDNSLFSILGFLHMAETIYLAKLFNGMIGVHFFQDMRRYPNKKGPRSLLKTPLGPPTDDAVEGT